MAKWYKSLGYGIFNGMIINHAEYLTLRKAGIVFIEE
jgi:hypothetical protein